jgi:CRP-like cAMP-binding protein
MTSYPLDNGIFAALPVAEQSRLLPHLERVELAPGKVLCEPGDKLGHVYFPTSAIVSMVYVMGNGASVEIALVGSEGVIGMALLMGAGSTPNHALVQSGGEAFRLKSHYMIEEFDRGGPTLRLLLRYMQALLAQTSQTAACNRHHTLEQQLCRWLLLTLDRLPSRQIIVTQELIANLLGVRREGVTAAARRLQLAGLIQYRRGRIFVLDRCGLERRSCECYAVVKNEYDRLLPTTAEPSRYFPLPLEVRPIAPAPQVFGLDCESAVRKIA